MGPVPEQVLPGTSTGPLNKVNTLNFKIFALEVAGRFGGGRVSTLYTFWDTIIPYRAESVHFSGAYELNN